MKKTFAFILALALLFSLAACSKATGETVITTTTTPPTTTTVATTTTAPVTQKTDAVGVLHDNVHLKGEKSEVFELPIVGATGFASFPINLFASASAKGKVVKSLKPGDAFTIQKENDEWWQVITEDGAKGWVQYLTCYLNIPDVIPSVVIENTNAISSVFVSSGVDIPEITSEQLYISLCENPRFNEKRHVVAANYNMVKKIYAAQQAALKEGYTLVINETFRPFDVQLKVSKQLAVLRSQNEKVKAGIDQSPWGIGWFISDRLSTHQMGCAMDVSLAKVSTLTWSLCGGYLYPTVTEYTSCEMPTPIHELSAAAVSLKSPVNSYSPTAWKNVAAADSMTEDALRLKKYCTQAGMSPLASEWWHFNDLDTKERINGQYVTDVFYLDTCVSQIPD